ncbi:hypothetical protein CEXT_711131 [Caerostris extrusa]|uniref:Uncharacterized protein n=1 Tax=Caerostris extrusa TaxID=172846 RepID=A0AAV4Y0G2_CAEEX|nr:hypothetical protein CEXT_711131 [Caerostris extrusa]
MHSSSQLNNGLLSDFVQISRRLDFSHERLHLQQPKSLAKPQKYEENSAIPHSYSHQCLLKKQARNTIPEWNRGIFSEDPFTRRLWNMFE